MQFLTTENGNAAIRVLPDTFDSHDFIKQIMTIAPQAYVKELNRFVDRPDPITIAHAQIARWLHSFTTVKSSGKVVSINVRGQETSNEQWEKVTQALGV